MGVFFELTAQKIWNSKFILMSPTEQKFYEPSRKFVLKSLYENILIIKYWKNTKIIFI